MSCLSHGTFTATATKTPTESCEPWNTGNCSGLRPQNHTASKAYTELMLMLWNQPAWLGDFRDIGLPPAGQVVTELCEVLPTMKFCKDCLAYNKHLIIVYCIQGPDSSGESVKTLETELKMFNLTTPITLDPFPLPLINIYLFMRQALTI